MGEGERDRGGSESDMGMINFCTSSLNITKNMLILVNPSRAVWKTCRVPGL